MNQAILDQIMQNQALDAIISFAYQTRLWYAKVMTSDGIIFIERSKADLIVDGRYIEYASQHAKNVKVHNRKNNFLESFVKTKNYQRIGIEKEYLTLQQLAMLKRLFPKANIVEISGQALREIKTPSEITKLKKACAITLTALASIEKMLKPGISEKAIERHLTFKLKEMGADKEAFDAIVVSGSRGALPHGDPSSKKIMSGELVTIDCGAFYQGYASDITRTFKIGQVSNPQLNEIFEIVKTAQQMGIKAIKPGILTTDIDKVCRDYIKSKGYGAAFLHSTGHGLGIDVHENPPISSCKSKKLKPGMVITVEPGIYIAGIGGVRFEDDILVTSDGYEILSDPNKASKALLAEAKNHND